MSALRNVDVAAVIDRESVSHLQLLVIALCMIVVILDGFDVQTIAFTGTAIAKEWGFAAFFTNSVVVLNLMNWIPSLAVAAGFTMEEGTFALLMLNLAGLGGSRRADASGEEHQAYLPPSVAQVYRIGPERDFQAG